MKKIVSSVINNLLSKFNLKITKFKTSKENTKTKNLNVGQLILHNIFGKGKIVSLTDSNEKMEVEFENNTKKTILVRYDKFDIID